MKSVTVAQLQALLALVAERPAARALGDLPRHRQRGGGQRARHPLGAGPPSRAGEPLLGGAHRGRHRRADARASEIKYWGIEFAHKRFAEAWVCAAEPPAARSVWPGTWRSTADRADAILTPEVERFAAHYAPSRERRDLPPDAGRSGRDRRPPGAGGRAAAVHRAPCCATRWCRCRSAEDPGGGYRHEARRPAAARRRAAKRRWPSCCPPGPPTAWRSTVRPALGAAHGSPLDHPAYTSLAVGHRGGLSGDRRGPLLPALERHRLPLLPRRPASPPTVSRRF